MTTNDFVKDLDKKIAELVKFDKPLLLSVKSVMALQSKRIFLDAKNKDGGDIGTYEGGEIYVNPNNSPKKFTPKGKSGATKKKNGEPYKTGYFANYLDYKKTIGGNKRTSGVDLLLFGELSRDWANAEVISKAEPKKVSPHEYVVDLKEFNKNKVERYGVDRVFGLSKFEKDTLLRVINDELLKALK